MAKTDAESRDGSAETLDDVVGETGFTRRTRARRDHDPVGLQLADLVERGLVVAEDAHFHTQFAEVMDEIVGKAVVVVDDHQHGGAKLRQTISSTKQKLSACCAVTATAL